MTEGLHEVYLGLGSNLGDRRGNIAEAVRLIGERVGQVVRQSTLIETEPWGFLSENAFLNGAVLCLTDKSPREVLAQTQQIERDLGKRKVHATRRGQMANGKVKWSLKKGSNERYLIPYHNYDKVMI